MPDILIRDLPDHVVAAVDAKARRAGLSRTEYIRRALAREGSGQASHVEADDLRRFSETFADLEDPDVMSRAWP